MKKQFLLSIILAFYASFVIKLVAQNYYWDYEGEFVNHNLTLGYFFKNKR